MVCMRMGLENVVDSIMLLRDKYQELIDNYPAGSYRGRSL
jgi:hypothetical protein